MALFKRDKGDRSAKDTANTAGQQSPAPVDEAVDRPATAGPAPVEPQEPVPHVGISMSTFGAPPPAPRPATPPTQPATPVNALLRSVLDSFPEKPEPTDLMNLMRQTMQGVLYVQVQGNATELAAAGQPMNLAVSVIEGKRYLLAFTSADAVRASVRAVGATDAAQPTSAVAQPAGVVLRNLTAGPYDGLILDHASDRGRAVIPAALVRRSLEEADDDFTLKNLMLARNTPTRNARVAEALTTAKLWVAAGQAPTGEVGLAEARGDDGSRRLQVFSHPLEVLALGRGDRPAPIGARQLAKTLIAQPGLVGVLIDTGGPWMKVDRDDLGPLLALADDAGETSE